MKYAVSGRQPKSVLKQADEIKMAYHDKDKIIDYIEEFTDKVSVTNIILKTMDEKIDLAKMILNY